MNRKNFQYLGIYVFDTKSNKLKQFLSNMSKIRNDWANLNSFLET